MNKVPAVSGFRWGCIACADYYEGGMADHFYDSAPQISNLLKHHHSVAHAKAVAHLLGKQFDPRNLPKASAPSDDAFRDVLTEFNTGKGIGEHVKNT